MSISQPIKWNPLDGGNGHFYFYQPLAEAASDLYVREIKPYRGLQGYLATITSERENSWISDAFLTVDPGKPGGWAFFGATDSRYEGEMRWLSGPEAGTLFYSGYVGSGGSPVLGAYSNWSPELNVATGGSEDYGVIRIDAPAGYGLQELGKWKDADGSAVYGFVAEWGGIEPSFRLTPSANTINEGETVTFLIESTNAEWGYGRTYSISGISAADIDTSSLSAGQYFFLDRDTRADKTAINGVATVRVTTLADQLTEGQETLIFSVGGVTSHVVVIDSSTSALNVSQLTQLTPNPPVGPLAVGLTPVPTPTFTPTPESTPAVDRLPPVPKSISLGTNLVTANKYGMVNQTELPFKFEFVDDISGVKGFVASWRFATSSFLPSTFTFSQDFSWPAATERWSTVYASGEWLLHDVTVYDWAGNRKSYFRGDLELYGIDPKLYSITTLKPPTTGYQIAIATPSSVIFEGQNAVFQLTGASAGERVSYFLSGVSREDLAASELLQLGLSSFQGSVVADSSGSGKFLVPIATDFFDDAGELLTIRVGEQTATITIAENSPTISVSTNRDSISRNESAVVSFYLSTLTDFNLTDITVGGGTLSNFSGSGTSYTATFTPTVNSTTPGVVSVASGVFSDAAGNANADGSDANNRVTITVNTVNTQSTLSPGASVYDEGQNALFSLTSAGGLAGSSVSYTVSGVTAADLTNGALSGSVVLGADGRATISIPIAADRLTEGNETLTVSVGGVSASTTIRDTSTAQPSSVSVAASGATKSYSVAFTQASVRSSDGGATWTVTTPSGVETLAAPDRLRFSDKTIALDFDRGEAGHKTVTMIGAAFGKGFINQYFGTGVSLFDSGQSMAQIAQLVVSTGLIESMVGSINSTWVRHVYKNVTGANPDAFTEAVYRTYLDNGTYTRAGLLELAAGVSALENQINLVGIRAEGIGYIPFI